MPTLFRFFLSLPLVSALSICLSVSGHGGDDPAQFAPPAATFSILALDPATGELGVAVQSKIVAVGAVVPFAHASLGAVATQAYANVAYGPAALLLLQNGLSPQEILEDFAARDPGYPHRQVAILSATGAAAAHTGDACDPASGHRIGHLYTVQGNTLASPEVLAAMAHAFESTAGQLLPDRLIAALRAGQDAGGDRRGMQSAALLVVRQGWGYGGMNDRFRDLRVDEHENPIEELARILETHRTLFPRPAPQ